MTSIDTELRGDQIMLRLTIPIHRDAFPLTEESAEAIGRLAADGFRALLRHNGGEWPL